MEDIKTFKNNKGKEYLFLEVPNDATNFNLNEDDYNKIIMFETKNNIDSIEIPKINFEIISTTKDITEEMAESIVELIGKNLVIGKEKTYKDYHPRDPWYKDSAKSSLQSLITSLGLDINKNYLILQKI